MEIMCYVKGVDDKGNGKMASTVYQLGDKLPCKLEEWGTFGELDQRDEVARRKLETFDDLIPVILDDAKPDQAVKIGIQLSTETRLQLVDFLCVYKDIFAWTHDDMLGIDPAVMVHRLNDDKKIIECVLPRRAFSGERYQAIGEEVDKILAVDFIREVE